MGDVRTCASCGADVPADAPGGACPRCALAGALPGAPADPTPEEVAAKLPAFEILGVLGRGGMGVVFKARQRALDRVVALKVLPPATARAPGFAERFVREAKAMARLTHPNIVAVHEFGETDGLCWLVLEFVDGVNVREAMRAGRIGPAEALTIVPQICDALQYAHDRGVVHRDIKPENVMIDRDGRVRIADFGLAKLADRETGDPSLTGASQVMGTLHYMAPEQWEHPKDVDHRCDIYSLGVVFYEMLTGELPVGKFEPPSRRAAIDVRVDEVVMRSLERNREQRWQRADEVKTKVTAISSTAAPAPAAPVAPQAGEDEVWYEATYANAAIAALVAVAFGVAAGTTDNNGLWWISGISALGAAIVAVQTFATRSRDAPAAVAPQGAWLSPVMAGVAASAVMVAIACRVWGIHTDAPEVGDAVGSLALVLVMVLVGLLAVRRHRVSQAAAAGQGPPGPPVLVGVASGAAFVLGLFCLVHAAFDGKRDNAAAMTDEAAARPRRRSKRPPADRAPWEFDVEVPKDSPSLVDDTARQGVWERWHIAQALEGGAWNDNLRSLYAHEDWESISRMAPAERDARAKENALGLPLVNREKVGAPLSAFWIDKVRFGGPAGAGTQFTSAYVTATDGERVLRFTMQHAAATIGTSATWRFTAAPVDIE